MSKRRNLVSIPLTLAGNALIVYLWYIILYPTQPITTFETVGATIIGTALTVVMGIMNWAIYDSCIS